MAPPDLLERIAHLAHRGAQAHRLDAQREQVALAGLCTVGQRVQRRLHRRGVAGGAHTLQALDLRVAHLDVVDVEELDRVLGLRLVLVDADDHVTAGVDARLLLGGAGLDLQLGPAGVDGAGHAAHGFDLLDDRPGLVGHVLRQLLHQVAAGPGVDHAGDVGLLLDDQLRVARDARAELGGQRDRLVEGCWCAGSACRRTPRPSPRSWCARCCCRDPARSATSRWSGCGCAASGLLALLAPKPFMIRHHSSRAARIFAISR